MLVDNSAQRNTKKNHKMCRNDLRVLTLRNYSKGYKIKNSFRLAFVSEDNQLAKGLHSPIAEHV